MNKCELSCNSSGLAAIIYDNRKQQASLTKVCISRCRIGVLVQGDCRFEGCHIGHCKQVGVHIDNNEDPLSVVLKNCLVNGCTEGIRGKDVDLVVVESVVKYCHRGIHITSSSFFQCIKSTINSCRYPAIVCHNVLSVQVSESCIYDCQEGIYLEDTRFIKMESNCIAYVRDTILHISHTMVKQCRVFSDE